MYLNENKNVYSLNVSELSLRSIETDEIIEKVKSSIVDIYSTFDSYWDLLRAYSVNNETFNKEFNEKRTFLQDNSSLHAHREIRYGFLATIKENMIHKVATEGLEVRRCPYNYFGHGISGIHISQNADVCMKEAESKVLPDVEIILIVFKYMLGRHKVVSMYDPDILLAPTPYFDSHLCEERPDPTEKISIQYIKSMVYLYEFANDQLDPVLRPRHCCPVSALVYKHAAPNFEENNFVKLRDSKYNVEIFPYLKTVQQKHWGREFLLKGPSDSGNLLNTINKNARNDSRKADIPTFTDRIQYERSLKFMDHIEQQEPLVRQFDRNIQRIDSREAVIPSYSNRIPDERSLKYMGHIEHQEPLQRQFYYGKAQEGRVGSDRTINRSRRDFNEKDKKELIYTERDRSFDRLQRCKEDARMREQPQHDNDYSSDTYKLVSNEHMSALRNWFQ